MIQIAPYLKCEDLQKSIESLEKTANNYPQKSLIHKTYMTKAIMLINLLDKSSETENASCIFQ